MGGGIELKKSGALLEIKVNNIKMTNINRMNRMYLYFLSIIPKYKNKITLSGNSKKNFSITLKNFSNITGYISINYSDNTICISNPFFRFCYEYNNNNWNLKIIEYTGAKDGKVVPMMETTQIELKDDKKEVYDTIDYTYALSELNKIIDIINTISKHT